jgi:hypothetical protein
MQFMSKTLLYCITLFLFISCTTSSQKVPRSILKSEKMVAVLIDIHLADAAVNLSNYGQSNLPNEKEKLYAEIYKKHNLDRKTFEESFTYYADRPMEFAKIFDEVIIGLSKKQAELSK